MKNYQAQGNNFLAKYGITFKATFKGDRCPLWEDGKHIHGDRYLITFRRKVNGFHKRFNISFWNSLNDKIQGNSPTPYDVLSVITKNEPGTFEDFCGNYGYDTDPRMAYQTYKAVVKEWNKINAFFNEEELTELQKIG